MLMYVNDNADTFPPHRSATSTDKSEFWGRYIFNYKPVEQVFRCPTLSQPRTDYGVTWEWAFDAHHIGYGYNGYFLGLHPYGPTSVTAGGLNVHTAPWFKMSEVLRPSMNLAIGDTNPKIPVNQWSSSLWWPFSGRERREGVNTTRHFGVGVVLFNDGHSETRREDQINPESDPAVSGSDQFIEFWDPKQRKKS